MLVMNCPFVGCWPPGDESIAPDACVRPKAAAAVPLIKLRDDGFLSKPKSPFGSTSKKSLVAIDWPPSKETVMGGAVIVKAPVTDWALLTIQVLPGPLPLT